MLSKIKWAIYAFRHKNCEVCPYYKYILRASPEIPVIESVFNYINSRHYFMITYYATLLVSVAALLLQCNTVLVDLVYLAAMIADILATRLEKDRE